MQVHVTYDRPEGRPEGPVQLGWLRADDMSGVIFPAPERLRPAAKSAHAKSAARCPAILSLEARLFQVTCPFDLHLGVTEGEKGWTLLNRAGQSSAVRPNKLNQHLHLVKPPELRDGARPILQLSLPYIFFTDEPAWLSQLPPYLHVPGTPWPGTMLAGRFPCSIWPRPLMWAFEWHDTGADLRLRRGEPLFYIQIEAGEPDRPIQLVEAEKTPEFQAYLDHISGAVNYVNQTFQLFREAEAVRPARLLTPRQR